MAVRHGMPTALKLGCITNLDTLFLVMGSICLVDEIQFMLISSCHICIRCIPGFSPIKKLQVYFFLAVVDYPNDFILKKPCPPQKKKKKTTTTTTTTTNKQKLAL